MKLIKDGEVEANNDGELDENEFEIEINKDLNQHKRENDESLSEIFVFTTSTTFLLLVDYTGLKIISKGTSDDISDGL